MTDDIRRLEELVPKLRVLNDFVASENLNCIEYETADGTCVGHGLYKSPEVSVQRAFMSAGTVFPTHIHDATEVLTLYKGKARVECDGMPDRVIGPGESCYFPKGSGHTVEALEDTWMIAVAVPMIEGYPNAT